MERPHWLTMLSRVSKWEPASGGKAEKAITAAYLAALLLSILAVCGGQALGTITYVELRYARLRRLSP